MHFDRDHAVAAARLAPAAFHVEREAARPEPAGFRFGHHGEQVANEREESGVRRRIRPRRPSDGRLIDFDHLVEELDALDAVVHTRLVAGPVERFGEGAIEDVVDERRLAGPADAGNGGQHAEGNPDVDVLQVVRTRATDDQFALHRGPASLRCRDRALARQVGARQRAVFGKGARQQIVRRSLENHVAPEVARAGAEIDDVIGDADRLLVVLHDDHRVAEIAQP